ncbi:MAG: endonuclease/exonuclease/phosphatase family protein [Clostridia bacterium]|nr:endonuclease/exonuclease/phosphatase family protein [Clostridia bacterium]
MKIEKKRSGVLLAALLSVAVLCVLLFAGCNKNDPAETTENAKATEPAIAGVSDPVKLLDGASVSFSPTGMRFTGLVNREYLDALKAAYGEENVKVGILVAPTDALVGNTVSPTNEKTVKLEAASYEADGNDYRFDGFVAAAAEKDYGNSYSAVAYVEVSGTVLRCSTYSAKRNALSFAVAADAAYLDLRDAADGTYKNAVTVDGKTKYSPYTAEQRTLLDGYRFPCSFTVMSYNIEVYDSSDGWEGRTPSKVIDTVKEQSPDIIGFQEVNKQWDSMLDGLASSGGYTRLKGGYTAYEFEKNEIFFKTSKFKLIAEGTTPLKQAASDMKVQNSENADLSLDSLNRVFHYAILEHKASGKTILFVSTHLHYGTTGSGSEPHDKVRRYQIRGLLAWLDKWSAKYPYQIVVGDMNANYTSGQGKTTMALYTDGGFQMTLQSATVKGDVGGTLAGQGRTARDVYVFDYILTRSNVGAAYYTVVDNNVDAGGKYPSDHLPVVSKLALR